MVAEATEAADDGQKKRRRGKRGGKRNRKDGDADTEAGELPDTDEAVTPAEVMAEEIVVASVDEEMAAVAEAVEPPKKPRRASRAKKAVPAETVSAADEPVAAAVEPESAKPEPAPAAADIVVEDGETARPSRRKPASSEPAVAVVSSTPPEGERVSEQPKRSGWWQRKSFF